MFGPKRQPISYSRMIKPGAKVGKANGLSMLLDAETFDYTFHKSASEGFKLAVQHHQDQPLMSVKELDVAPGFETQIAVTPVLYETTEEAKQRFKPSERGCYFEGELTFKYLPQALYRYDISNCLFEATYEKVLDVCHCTPYFHWAGVKRYRNFCRGPSLRCMNEIFSRLGEYNEVIEADADATSGQPQKKRCLAACKNQVCLNKESFLKNMFFNRNNALFLFQINEVAVTTSRLPNKETFLQWADFCVVVAKLVKTCQGWKRPELDDRYPRMCERLSAINSTGDVYDRSGIKLCKAIRSARDDTLIDSLHAYARQNLALVNIYIKQPVVTRILRDQRIPVIWFVANCGGILGLCMGFSIVTVFEVLHCLCKFLSGSISRWISTNIPSLRKCFKKSKRSDNASDLDSATPALPLRPAVTESTATSQQEHLNCTMNGGCIADMVAPSSPSKRLEQNGDHVALEIKGSSSVAGSAMTSSLTFNSRSPSSSIESTTIQPHQPQPQPPPNNGFMLGPPTFGRIHRGHNLSPSNAKSGTHV